jgi:hypothetical protein
MTNNTFFANNRSLFGKTLAIAFLLVIFSVASYAQSNNLYYQSGGAYYGRVTVYPSHFQIETNGTVIKTFSNSCRNVGSGGLLCTFGQFNRDGRHIYSGQGYFYQNGYVYLRWTNENIANQWRQINTQWYAFIPR